MIKIPPDHVARANAHGSASYGAWTRARPANDFAAMRPYLERTLDLSREYPRSSRLISMSPIRSSTTSMRA